MTVARPPAILDHLSALADTTRSRILLLLDRHELTVSELCAVFQVPQSSMSRQLRLLVDEGWLAWRAEGTSRRYRATPEVMEWMEDPPGYSAVRATLRVLEEKGHVTHREDGPRYVYLPTVPTEAAREDALRHVMATFFNGSLDQTVTALLRMSDVDVADGEIERLRNAIRQARQSGR